MRCTAFYILIFLGCSAMLSSQVRLDSLHQKLNNALEDTAKVHILFDLGGDYQNNQAQPDSAVFYYEKAVLLSQKLSYTEGVFDNLFAKGIVIQYNKGDESAALSIYNDCLKIAERANDYRRISRAYYAMALVNDHQRNDIKFWEYVRLANKNAELSGDASAKIKPLVAIGGYYESKGKMDSAEVYFLRAYTIFNNMTPATQLYRNNALVLSNLGNFYEKLGKPKQALFYLQKVLPLMGKIDDKQSFCNALLSVAQLNFKEKNYETALGYTNRILKYQHIKAWYIQEVIVETLTLQSNIFAQMGKYDKALAVHISGDALNDSLQKAKSSEDIRLNTLKIQSAFDLERKQNELKKQQLYSLLIALFGAFIVILALLLYRNNRKKDAQNKQLKRQQIQLEIQKTELSYLNNTKDKLFSIIAHDLRAPLSSLKVLLTLWDAKILSAEKFEEISTKVKTNVNTLYGSLENLLEWSFSQLKGIKPKPICFDIRLKANEEITLLSDTALNKNIRLENNISENAFVEADINQIGVVVRNLTSNAIKFTPPGGSIYFTSLLKETEMTISIRDEGVGMSPMMIQKVFTVGNSDVRRGTANEKGTGLGLIVVKEFVESNGGKLNIESVENQGTTISFTLKKADFLMDNGQIDNE